MASPCLSMRIFPEDGFPISSDHWKNRLRKSGFLEFQVI